MYKLLLVGLLAVSSLSYAGADNSKAKKAKGKTKTSCTASCAQTKSCKPGCLPAPAGPQPCK